MYKLCLENVGGYVLHRATCLMAVSVVLSSWDIISSSRTTHPKGWFFFLYKDKKKKDIFQKKGIFEKLFTTHFTYARTNTEADAKRSIHIRQILLKQTSLLKCV